jgi:hypothetical protein
LQSAHRWLRYADVPGCRLWAATVLVSAAWGLLTLEYQVDRNSIRILSPLYFCDPHRLDQARDQE